MAVNIKKGRFYSRWKVKRDLNLVKRDKVETIIDEKGDNIQDNIDVGWREGRRIVVLGHLADQLFCLSCENRLHLSGIKEEKKYGLGSYLNIARGTCSNITTVTNGKRHSVNDDERPLCFDINTKLAAAMIHVGVGETQVANILAEMNIPQPTPRTVKKREREIGNELEKAAETSCLAELEREKEKRRTQIGINTSIIQMAMTHAESNQTFSCYVKPKCGFIPNNITQLTGIMLCNNIMYHNGIEVNPLVIKEACRQMMQFLKQFAPVILVAHNVLFDSKVLIQNMNECSLTCNGVIDGFKDTLRLFKNKCPERKTTGQNYKEEDLVRDILGKDYNAQSAIADTNELLQLVRTVYDFEEKLPVYDTESIENRIKR